MIVRPWGKQERKRTEPEKRNKLEGGRVLGVDAWFFLTDCQAGGVNESVPGLDQHLHIAVQKEANESLIEDQMKAWWPSDAFTGRALSAWRPELWS